MTINFHIHSVIVAVIIFPLVKGTYGGCRANEILVDEASSCPDETCYTPRDCPSVQAVASGVMVCRCRRGYVRNYKTGNGTCIQPVDCPRDLAVECHRSGGEWIGAGQTGCEKNCESPDLCVHMIPPQDTCFCGLDRVREYLPDGDCIYKFQCRGGSNPVRAQYIYLCLYALLYISVQYM